jgi:hypothetical protein
MKNLGLIVISDSITLDLIVKPGPIVLVLTAKKLLDVAGQPNSSFHPKAVRSGWETRPNAIGSY